MDVGPGSFIADGHAAKPEDYVAPRRLLCPVPIARLRCPNRRTWDRIRAGTPCSIVSRRRSLAGKLADWCRSIPGLFRYYPGHRRVPAGPRAFIEVLHETTPQVSPPHGHYLYSWERYFSGKLKNHPSRATTAARRVGLADNPFTLCASPAYIARLGMPATTDELVGHPCIRLHGMDRWAFTRDGETLRFRITRPLSASTVDAVRAACIAGFGIAMMIYWDVHEQFERGELQRIVLEDVKPLEIGIWAVISTRTQMPPGLGHPSTRCGRSSFPPWLDRRGASRYRGRTGGVTLRNRGSCAS